MTASGAAHVSVAAAGACLLLLASLHLLSPEFDPSFRVVSEYANGRFAWVLSLMFIAWAISSWALAFAIWPWMQTGASKIGVLFLVIAGVGEAMASVFDLHHRMHDVAGALGVPGLPLAALLISLALSRTAGWSDARSALLWTAGLTWVVLALMMAALMLIHRINVVGYPNRMLVVVYCFWTMVVAREVLKRRKQQE